VDSKIASFTYLIHFLKSGYPFWQKAKKIFTKKKVSGKNLLKN